MASFKSTQFGQAIVTARNDDHDEEKIEGADKPRPSLRKLLCGGRSSRFAVRAIERPSDLRNVHSVRGWLSRILATTIADYQRRAIRLRRREVLMEQQDLELASQAITPDPEIDQVVCDCLYKLLPTLKADYADIIWRADILGEPRERIATSLGTTLNNITVRVHRGRQALRKRLEDMCLTCPCPFPLKRI